jgi:O-antigen/teichoic acid export membrane protein
MFPQIKSGKPYTSQLSLWLARGSIVSVAPIVEFASRFGRTALLSRLLVPNEFGTATAINVVIGVVALVTDMAIYKFVMISPNNARALAAGHLLSLVRGFFVTVTLVFCAPLIAASFGVPQFASSFAIIAFVPLIQSLSHLGIRQVEGNYDYLPETIALLSSQLMALIVLVAAVCILRDHRAIIVSLLTECGCYTIVSHLLARTEYRLRSDRASIFTLLAFGIPLVLNGMGVAAGSQLDRYLIGSWFDVSTLALYAIILSMTVVPVSVIDRIFGKIALSYLVSKQDISSAAAESYRTLIFVFSILATCYSLFIAISLDWLTPLIFGAHFRVSPSVHILMTFRVFFLIQMMGAPTALLAASGRTRELALLSLSGSLGLVFATSLIHWWLAIDAVILGLLMSDILRFPLFFIVPARNYKTEWRVVVSDLLAAFFVLMVVVGAVSYSDPLTPEKRGLILCVGMAAIAVQFMFGLRRHEKLQTLLKGSWERTRGSAALRS